MKKLVSLLLALSLMSILILTGCGSKCEHLDTHLGSSTATCTSAGVETYVCDDCGEVTETKEVEAYGHVYGEKTETNYKCKYCDLVQFNVNAVSIPETITARVETQGTTKTTKVTVRSFNWYYGAYNSSDSLILELEVTIDEKITNFPPIIAYSLSYAEGSYKDSNIIVGDTVVEGDSRDSTGETVIIRKYINVDKTGAYGGQYFLDVSFYETFTAKFPYGPASYAEFVSGTMNAE